MCTRKFAHGHGARGLGPAPNVRTVEGVDRPIMIRKLGFWAEPTRSNEASVARVTRDRGIRRRARVSKSHIAPEPDSLQPSFHRTSRHPSNRERGRCDRFDTHPDFWRRTRAIFGLIRVRARLEGNDERNGATRGRCAIAA